MNLKPTISRKARPKVSGQEIRLIIEHGPQKASHLTPLQAVVAVCAILVSGSVAASAIYGYATNDYSVLKSLGESVSSAIPVILKALK